MSSLQNDLDLFCNMYNFSTKPLLHLNNINANIEITIEQREKIQKLYKNNIEIFKHINLKRGF